MLANTDKFLCSNYLSSINPLTILTHTNIIPRHFKRISNSTFLHIDTLHHDTNILSSTLHSENHSIHIRHQIIASFAGTYTTANFCANHCLLINSDGDLICYNLLNKNIYFAEKQHPGLFTDADILQNQSKFITCGGNVKPVLFSSDYNNKSCQRIIKTWQITQNDELILKSRINTHHQKPIQYSTMQNKHQVITLSTDKTIRRTNLIQEQVDNIINVDSQMYSACPLDYQTVIFGGISKSMPIYDLRTKKQVINSITIDAQLVQVNKIIRLTSSHVLIANINELYVLDLHKMQIMKKGQYEGERICELAVLNASQFIVGNKEKTYQIWQSK